MGFMGGMATLSGPIIGALIIIPAQQYFALEYGQNGYYLILYGVLFLAVILLLPEGIVPTISKRWKSWQATRFGEAVPLAGPPPVAESKSVTVERG